MRSLAAAAALAVAALTAGGALADAAPPLGVHGILTPHAIRFADPLVAEVDVEYDPAQVDRASIRVVPAFAPFSRRHRPSSSHDHRGDLAVLKFRYALQCLTDGCLPLKGALNMRLPRLSVTGSADGRTVRASAAWPELRVVTRLPNSTANGHVVFRHQSNLPPPDYAVSPGTSPGG